MLDLFKSFDKVAKIVDQYFGKFSNFLLTIPIFRIKILYTLGAIFMVIGVVFSGLWGAIVSIIALFKFLSFSSFNIVGVFYGLLLLIGSYVVFSYGRNYREDLIFKGSSKIPTTLLFCQVAQIVVDSLNFAIGDYSLQRLPYYIFSISISLLLLYVVIFYTRYVCEVVMNDAPKYEISEDQKDSYSLTVTTEADTEDMSQDSNKSIKEGNFSEDVIEIT